MRVLAVTACIGIVTTAPALACPRQVLCVVAPEATPGEVAPARKSISLDLRSVRLAPNEHVAFDVPAEPARATADGEIEMPWIWAVLREQVHARLPRYEHDERFRLVLSPVAVSSPSDTTPGLGVAGAF